MHASDWPFFCRSPPNSTGMAQPEVVYSAFGLSQAPLVCMHTFMQKQCVLWAGEPTAGAHGPNRMPDCNGRLAAGASKLVAISRYHKVSTNLSG